MYNMRGGFSGQQDQQKSGLTADIEEQGQEAANDFMDFLGEMTGNPPKEHPGPLLPRKKYFTPVAQSFLSGYMQMKRIGTSIQNRRSLPLMPHLLPPEMESGGYHM